MKSWFGFLLSLLLTSLVIAACNGALAPDQAGSAVDSPTPAPVTITADQDVSTGNNCPEATSGNHQLRDAAHGICFLYPDTYDVFQGEDSSITVYLRSLLNTEAPSASIHFEPANGRTLEEITAQRIADFAFPDTQAETITLGGQTATMLDNLPGQDVNRRVVAVHDGLVYDLVISRISPDYGPVGEEAEALHELITSSLQFTERQSDAQLRAGPECPEERAETLLYTDKQDGFCLLVPEGYTVDDSLAADSGDTETAVFRDSLQDVSHARLFITVEDSNGRSLDEITFAREAEIEIALPGVDVSWSFGYMLDGVPANQFDQLPGQDLSREVILVRDGRVYTLSFIPDDPDAGEAYVEMQALYELAMDSFSFLWQESRL